MILQIFSPWKRERDFLGVSNFRVCGGLANCLKEKTEAKSWKAAWEMQKTATVCNYQWPLWVDPSLDSER